MCDEIQYEEGTLTQAQGDPMVDVEECTDGAGDYHQCTLRDLSLISCYKLWLVVEDGYNKVRSLPVFVSPIDCGECLRSTFFYTVLHSDFRETSFHDKGNDNSDTQLYFCSPVKPSPPSVLKAVTLPNKTLSATWKRPYLPAYDLQYELRYVSIHSMVDIKWKVRKDLSCAVIV